ncbi:hypothetical protein L0244_22810, partial [bacterium]|nr:hypothetical protein [bacterium]
MRGLTKGTLVLFMLFASTAWGGAWLLPKGESYYKISTRLYFADEFYEPGGSKIPINRLGNQSINLYGEYGITDWLSVSGYVPFYERSTLSQQVDPQTGFVYFPGDNESGLADSSVGIVAGLIRNRSYALSAGIQLGLPVGDDSQENGLVTGDGEFNQLLYVSSGYSF